MSILELWLLAVALAMDCFTVSIVFGVLLRKIEWRTILVVAFLFGLFQAMMPLAGWLATNYFSSLIEDYDHWIAFGLLAFLGGRMIKESFSDDEEEGEAEAEAKHINPRKLKTQLVFAVATSIDALAVGISFTCLGFNTISSLSLPLLIIGFVSLAFSIVGSLLGIRFGKGVEKRLKPELLGGIVLIIIGVRVLCEHLFGL